MDALAVVAMIGRMVAMFSLLMLVPLAWAVYAAEPVVDALVRAAATSFAIGVAASLLTRRFRRELQPRDGFLLVGLTWSVLPAFGALPLLLMLPQASVTDAYFEAVSALTASGATVFSDLDAMPKAVHVWRCLMTWVGGLGIIVLAVAILPMLGIGGSQLFRAEITGPMKDSKLTPRIADTARAIWGVYVLLSLACALAYRAAGMSWLDAFLHMGSTVSLGGFSPYDASFGHWNSPAIEAVAVVFMMLSGVNLTMSTSSGASVRRRRCGAMPRRVRLPRRARQRAADRAVPVGQQRLRQPDARHCATRCSTSSRWPRPPATPPTTTRSGRCSRRCG
ncbi:MAG: potassium transporter TrkG [Rubrivivax sp.]